jgi:glycosyltransferase involved in cell wall biosynthesis
MYAALNEGFARATGDIHAWIPADDLYEKGAFKAVATVFAAYQDVAWLRGATTSINGQGEVVQPGCRQIYYTPWLRAGVYGMEAYHVDQPSVFWRAPLWQKGGVFPKGYTLNADYWLWTSFAKYERLWTIDAPLSLYRKHPEQGSIVFMLECKKQMWRSRGNKRPLIAWAPRFFFHPYFHIVPLSWRKSMERLYPFLFPHHPREYIAFDERGAPVKRTLASFISCS